MKKARRITVLVSVEVSDRFLGDSILRHRKTAHSGVDAIAREIQRRMPRSTRVAHRELIKDSGVCCGRCGGFEWTRRHQESCIPRGQK
jgi:hypothetical protein